MLPKQFRHIREWYVGSSQENKTSIDQAFKQLRINKEDLGKALGHLKKTYTWNEDMRKLKNLLSDTSSIQKNT